MKRVLIFGESPLVEEYALLFVQQELNVHVRLNSREKAAALPKTIKNVAKPGKAYYAAFELTNTSTEAKKKNLKELDKATGSKTVILSSSVTLSLAEQTAWLKKPERLIGIGALPSLLNGSLIELTQTSGTDPRHLQTVTSLLKKLGKEHALVADGVGMVLPRVLCMLTNEAFFALAECVAPASGIDTAMKLGTNYPKGPVEWAQKIGFQQVLAVLEALYRTFREDRYRVAPLLRQTAFSGSLPPPMM